MTHKHNTSKYPALCEINPMKLLNSEGKYLTYKIIDEEEGENEDIERMLLEFKYLSEISPSHESFKFGMSVVHIDEYPNSFSFFPSHIPLRMKYSLSIGESGVYALKKNEYSNENSMEITPHITNLKSLKPNVWIVDYFYETEKCNEIPEFLAKFVDVSVLGRKQFNYFPSKYDVRNGNVFEYDQIVFLSDIHISTHRNVYYPKNEKLYTYEDIKTRLLLITKRLSNLQKRFLEQGLKTMYILCGDVVDRGTKSEIDLFDLVADQSKIPHDDILVVPGNHEYYSFIGISGVLESRKRYFYDHFYGINNVDEEMEKTTFIKKYEIQMKDSREVYSIVTIDTSFICYDEPLSKGGFNGSLRLIEILEEIRTKKSVIIVMHHPLMDIIKGKEELKEIFLKYQELIKFIVCGHKHGMTLPYRDFLEGSSDEGKTEVIVLQALFHTLENEDNILNSSLSFVLKK